MKIQISDKITPLYSSDKRYVIIYGGRGSGKSWAVADFLIAKALESPKRILCCREIQNSIKDSSHRLLTDRINYYELQDHFEITEHEIRAKNGSSFLFKGLFRNETSLKSLEGVDLIWIEEAQSVSKKSLEVLIPTIRKPKSQLIFTYNPTLETDPVHQDFNVTQRDDVLKIEINCADNPWFPEVLQQELEYDRRVDTDKYLHIWEGQCVKHSQSQVFAGKWVIDEFEISDLAIYYGADWGFSTDPSVLIKMGVKDKNLYILDEAYGVGIDIDKLPELFLTILDKPNVIITADSSRPETISYVKKHGLPNIKACRKHNKGTYVEEGISFIRSFEKIIIHPRCKHTIDEFRNYSYKVDRLTGNITSDLEDKNNHIIDSIRYALEDVMRNNTIYTVEYVGW